MSILLSEQEQFRARIDAIAKCDKPTDEVIFKCQLEAQDAKSIAARDKWWIEQIENICHWDESGLGSEITLHQWQSLKQSILEAKQ